MSDINIEDFIHETRSMQDSYDRADSRDCLDDVFADAELREYLDKALTLARSYDKLLRELDVANAQRFALPTWDNVGMRPHWWQAPTYGPIDTGTPLFPNMGNISAPYTADASDIAHLDGRNAYPYAIPLGGAAGTVWEVATPATASEDY
jgi:hypothetical protein